ncbi:hypothetical protein ONZ45_g12369 [Pleurotus djamor]|nr:hypothetical protein ONZ45_g12369 [Pleurotus djamor]
MTVATTNNDDDVRDDIEDPQRNLKKKRTPLPIGQLFITSLLQGAEPISSSVIYPFINQYVRESGITGGDESKTGYYAGVILITTSIWSMNGQESVFYLTECLTVIHWGRLSDRIGRKPVMLMGSIQGMSNGNMGMTKNIMAEITDETNIADAFAWMPLIWSAGSTFGPIIGGALSNPATRWPSVFGNSQFLVDHAYFLPCAAAAGYAALCFVIGWVFLNETLPSIVARRKAKSSRTHSPATPEPRRDSGASDATLVGDETTPLLTSSPPSQTHEAPSVRSVLTPNVVISLINLAILAFTDMCAMALQPLMYSTPVALGGLGFSPYTIGMTMGIYGFINGVYQVTIFPRINRRFGPRRTYIFGYGCLLITIGAYPIMTFFARRAGGPDPYVWALLIFQLCANSQLFMAYGVTPSPAALATINGMGQMSGSIMRSIAPSFSTSLFSLSLQRNLAGGLLVYYVLLSLVVCGIYAALQLPKRMRP